MTEARGRDEQCGLDFVTLHALDQLRQHLLDEARGVRDVAAETPPDLVETPDDAVAFKLREAINGDFRFSVLYDSRRAPTTRAVEQIPGLDLARNLAETCVAADDFRVERVRAVDVRPRRRDERQIHHRQRTPRRGEGRAFVLDEREIVADLPPRAAARPALLPFVVPPAP